jgi:hypothetical protein
VVVHLYDWPEIGPEVEVMCDGLGLKYEAPANVESWWCPTVTQVIVYTKNRQTGKPKVRKARRLCGTQLLLPL